MSDLRSLCIVELSDPSAGSETSVNAIIDRQHSFGCKRMLEVLTEYAGSTRFHMLIANEESYDDHWEIDFTSMAEEVARKVYLNMRLVSGDSSEWKIWAKEDELGQDFFTALRKFVCSRATYQDVSRQQSKHKVQ